MRVPWAWLAVNLTELRVEMVGSVSESHPTACSNLVECSSLRVLSVEGYSATGSELEKRSIQIDNLRPKETAETSQS